MATWRSSRRDFGTDAWHCVGARPVLSRRDDFELEILLHRASHFFNRDYGVFDCGGMALSKANLKIKWHCLAFEVDAWHAANTDFQSSLRMCLAPILLASTKFPT